MHGALLRIQDGTQIGAARRRARVLADEAGFTETEAEKVAIVVTELCTNVLKHGRGGQVQMHSFPNKREFEIVAVDHGPGMADIEACLRDGFTTTETSGNGLGAVQRFSSFCDVYSAPGQGVAVMARIHAGRAPTTAQNGDLRTGAFQVPKDGEDVCGDAWTVIEGRDRVLIAVADGLGHGPGAAEASQAAIDSAHRYADLAPKDIVDAMNMNLRHTRGAAVAVAALDRERNLVSFAGLGNISGCVCEGASPARHLISMNGTAGMGLRRIQEYQLPWPPRSLLILHSDGVSARWDLREYPGLFLHDPAIIAGVLFRDHGRRTDDATIVAVR